MHLKAQCHGAAGVVVVQGYGGWDFPHNHLQPDIAHTAACAAVLVFGEVDAILFIEEGGGTGIQTEAGRFGSHRVLVGHVINRAILGLDLQLLDVAVTARGGDLHAVPQILDHRVVPGVGAAQGQFSGGFHVAQKLIIALHLALIVHIVQDAGVGDLYREDEGSQDGPDLLHLQGVRVTPCAAFVAVEQFEIQNPLLTRICTFIKVMGLGSP